jgi:RNA polymerase sigma factor (sigma-70 family)
MEQEAPHGSTDGPTTQLTSPEALHLIASVVLVDDESCDESVAALARSYQLYARYWHSFVWTARRELNDYARGYAEDLVSDVILDLGRGAFASVPRGEELAARYVRGVIRRRAAHLNRREARLVALEESFPGSVSADPGRQCAQCLLAADVSTALATLTPRERQVAALHWLQQCSNPEIAEALSISVNTVKELLRRAGGKLRLQLARHASVDEGIARWP